MSRMRMQGEIVEIDATALRFDVSESGSFLVDLAGLDLDQTDVEELTEKTDGWVAALQLASLTLRDRDDPVQLIETMTGRHHVISEFLAENVLETLEPSTLDFLLATSIPERICGGLASALTDVPDGQAILEKIEERDLFLRRIDDQWFRYHQLFRDFLRHRLSRERVCDLHRRACRWYAGQRLVREAVDHALAAGDETEAVRLVENDGLYLVSGGQMATLIGLTAKLPQDIVRSNPRLQLALAWANIVLHRVPAARDALARVEATMADAGLSEDEIADMRAEADVVRAIADLRSDRLSGIDEHVAACLQRRDRMPPFSVATAATVATFAAAYRYDLDEVERIQTWAAPYYERSGDAFSIVNGLCFCGIAHHLMLNNAVAEQTLRRALRIAKRSGGIHSYAGRLASSLLGEILYEKGDLAEAERLLDEGYKLGPEGGSVDFKIARYVISARIKALQGDRLGAAQRLDEATRVARSLSLNRLQALAEHERIRLGLPRTLSSGRCPWCPTTRAGSPSTPWMPSRCSSRRRRPSGGSWRAMTQPHAISPAAGPANGLTGSRRSTVRRRCCGPAACWARAWPPTAAPPRPRPWSPRSPRSAHSCGCCVIWLTADRRWSPRSSSYAPTRRRDGGRPSGLRCLPISCRTRSTRLRRSGTDAPGCKVS